MYTKDQIHSIHLSDAYTLFYAMLGQQLIDDFGVSGEAVLREATRRYGRDRGRKRRQGHLDANIKINMKNLFSIGSDLPGDPRFGRDRLDLIPEERISHTLACPMSDTWRQNGYRYVGRIYCEEFHPACYMEYAYGYTKVGLAKTLTQEGDEYCAFNIILRPENLPDELKPVCFEQYDPYYEGQNKQIPAAHGKTGFNSLCVRVYYYMMQVIDEQLGSDGVNSMRTALEKIAVDQAARLKAYSAEMNEPLDEQFVEDNFPLYRDPDADLLWADYSGYGALALLKEAFYPKFNAELFGE